MRAHPPDRPHLWLAWLLALAALAAACNSESQRLLDQAEISWRKGNYEEAIQANLNLYRRDGRGRYAAHALLNIGNIYYLNLRQLKEAIEYYDKLTQEFPDKPEALQARRQLASIYANEEVIRDLDQAIAQYDRLLDANGLTDRPEIEYQRADAYFQKGEYDRALRALLNLEDSGISGRLAAQTALKIGDIYQLEKRFPEAIEPFRKALASNCPECRQRAILSLAETYEYLLNFDMAIETIRLLDKTRENEKFIFREVERLTKMRKEVERTGSLNWERPRANDAATRKSGTTPVKK